jgi:signal transduction histidine kinase
VAARALAHEVKTPLNALAVHIELLRQSSEKASDTPRSDAVRDRSLVSLEDSIRQIDHMVGDFMDYSAPLMMNREPVDFSEVLRASLDAVLAQCQTQGISLEINLPQGPWPLLGDGARLRQVCDNLLRNAVEAQPNGGSICAAGARDGGQVEVRLGDRGPGIPPERRNLLFEFGHSSKPGGSGIGLPLSQLIIEAHGGRLACESCDAGTTFKILLPLVESAT